MRHFMCESIDCVATFYTFFAQNRLLRGAPVFIVSDNDGSGALVILACENFRSKITFFTVAICNTKDAYKAKLVLYHLLPCTSP